MHPLEALPRVECAREFAQALRPRVWHDCALFFFDLGISYFAGFGTRLGRILAVQNQIHPFYGAMRLIP